MAARQSYLLKESVVRGHHVYKHIWMPGINEELSVEKEPGNLHDSFAVFVVKNDYDNGAHSAQHVPSDYSRTGVYYCTGLVTPGIKMKPDI